MKSFLKSQVTDDRGRVWPGLDLGELMRAEEGGGQRKELATRLKLAVKVESGRMKSLRFVRIGIGVTVATVLIGIQAALGVRLQPWFYWIFFGAAAIAIRFVTKRQIDQQLSSSALAEGFCGSCGYSLRSTPVAEDGCMECPECGAAWKPGRISRPHWDSGLPPIDEKVGFLEMVIFLTPSREFLTVADDRGRYVRSLDRWMRLLSKERREKLGEPTVREIRRRLAKIGIVRRVVSTVIACVAILLPVFVLRYVGGGKVPEVVQLVVALSCGLMLILFIWQGFRGSKGCRPARVVRELTAMGLCGACGDQLAGREVEADGCVVCPSCRAAWRTAPPIEQSV